MFLLPRNKRDFLKEEYWDSFFKKRGKEAFEWYGEYRELCGVIHRYIKPADTILVIGCGNSTVSSDLYDLGYKKITNIDVSNVVVKRMQQKYAKNRPGLRYLRMDALQTEFESESFTTIFDKGTLDALFPDNTDESLSRITRLFDEIDRLLKVGGRYICISLLQEFILNFSLDYFFEKGWLIRICRCVEVEKNRVDGSCLPVFALVCTKIRKIANVSPIVEISLDDDNVVRTDKDNLINMVRSIQQAEVVCNGVSRNCVNEYENEVVIEVARPSDTSTRYTITIIDPPVSISVRKMTFAAFVVPFNRENDWIFSSVEGREELRRSCQVDRVAMICTHRDHTYPDFKGIQDELSETIIKLAPAGVTDRGEKVSFLTTTLDDATESTTANDSSRSPRIRVEGETSFSGRFVVRDVTLDNNERYRQLVFSNFPNVIQSEVKLKKDEIENEEEIDFNYVACEYHALMNAILFSAANDCKRCKYEILLIGLGGGVLTNLLHRCFQQAHITAIEIDPKIYEIAKEHFHLNDKDTDRIKVNIADGLSFIRESKKQGLKYDAVILDVDSKNPAAGISCPPVEFVETNILNELVAILNDEGLFLVNLVCRSDELRGQIMNTLRLIFAGVIAMKTSQDVNRVVVCSKEKCLLERKRINKSIKNFYNQRVNKCNLNLQKDDPLDVIRSIENVQI